MKKLNITAGIIQDHIQNNKQNGKLIEKNYLPYINVY